MFYGSKKGKLRLKCDPPKFLYPSLMDTLQSLCGKAQVTTGRILFFIFHLMILFSINAISDIDIIPSLSPLIFASIYRDILLLLSNRQ